MIIRKISHRIISICPIYSGHCGWSFYWSMVDPDEKKLLEIKARNWFKRYPGLFYGKPLSFLEFIGDGLLSVSWLTYLSIEVIESHGKSMESLINHLKEINIRADLIGESVLEVQATEMPELGDRNRNDVIPGYMKVGKELAFAGLTEDQAFYLPIAGLEMEERVGWYQRFLVWTEMSSFKFKVKITKKPTTEEIESMSVFEALVPGMCPFFGDDLSNIGETSIVHLENNIIDYWIESIFALPYEWKRRFEAFLIKNQAQLRLSAVQYEQ